MQGELEAAWTRFTGETVRWNFAGRTDAGVHARGQVANTRTEAPYDLATVQRAMNALLPDDLAVRAAREAPHDFHARYSAWRRDYRYVILNEPWPAPLLRKRALHAPAALDVEAMHSAAQHLLGEHDFAAFGAPTGPSGDGDGPTVRHCYVAQCAMDTWHGQRIIVVDLAASGFLRHMVRAIVGTLIRIGQGKRAPESMATILASCDRKQAGPNAAPHGLYLEAVHYKE